MSFAKRIIFFLAVFIGKCYAQSAYNITLPQILPASPEATQFVKAGVGNANMSTGAANVSIPLYTIKMKDFSFPISLAYSTQGLKQDEASTRVGLGWTLNATAMVTRSVKGKPDEFAQRMVPPADFSLNTDPVFNYCMDASNSISGGDSQPDEFQFSCNGYSGKFILDNNYQPQITASCNLKISVAITVTPNSTAGSIGIITITTPDGVIYSFGTNSEKTTTHNIGVNNPYRAVTKTSFFLDKITLPTGEFINFLYQPINTRVETGITQTLQLAKINGDQQCGDCNANSSYTTQTDKVEYATNYLTGIHTSGGMDINLSYQPRIDLSYDNRLTTLEVVGLKKYGFEYYDVAGSSTKITGRYFLTKLKDIRLDNPTNEPASEDYVFTYDRMSEVSLPISFKQDYLGFSRGGGSGGYFIPPTLNYVNSIDFSFRNPVSGETKKGTLTKIEYPTGGTEEFVYEGNTSWKPQLRNTMATYDLQGPGGGSSGSFTQLTYTKCCITVPRDQLVTFSVNVADRGLNDGYSFAGSNPNAASATIYLYEGTTLIGSKSCLGFTPASTTLNLLVGHVYNIKLTVKAYTEIGYCTLLYNNSATDIYDNVVYSIPGVRLRQLKYYDPVANVYNSKYYTYSSLSDLSLPSGSLLSAVSFKSNATSRTFCGQFYESQTECYIDIYSSSSTNDVYNYSGSGSLIYYSSVIESDDPAFANGGTEYSFAVNDNGGNQETILGNTIQYLSMGQYPTESGMAIRVRKFDKNKVIIQDDITTNETLFFSYNVPSYFVRKNYLPISTRPDRMEAFDVARTHYDRTWIRVKQKVSNTISSGVALTQQTDYSYGAPYNILPKSIITKDSKDIVLKTEMKYPTESLEASPDPLLVTPINSTLVSKNIVTPVILQNSYRNGVLLQQKHIVYKDWFSDGKILQPQFIRVKESSTDALHDELVYNRYDTHGNPLELQIVNDIKYAYTWDIIHGLPLSETKDAGFDQVAYCGFETKDDGLNVDFGSWQYGSGSLNSTVSFTGSYSFSGTLTKTIAIAGSYTVSVWTNTAVTVNGSAGTLKKTVRGWNLYEWALVNPTTLTVIGTNIDDLQLFPSKAQMTAFSYKPFIGISSKSDIKRDVVYYEYDGKNRLALIRDINYNILKQLKYRTSVFIANAAVWNATGNLRCKPCSTNTAFGSPMQQHEEKDINSESVTYNSLRWVDDGVPGSCTNVASWQNTATALRCEVTARVLTGYQQQEQKDMNPCSSTYNTLRWTTVGLNTTACPTNNIVVSCNNLTGQSGFIVKYTNAVNGQIFSFIVGATGGTSVLGSVPPANYNITISKSGNTVTYYYQICGPIQSGTGASFLNKTVNGTNCNSILISATNPS